MGIGLATTTATGSGTPRIQSTTAVGAPGPIQPRQNNGGRIPESVLDTIKDRADIVEIVSRRVPLKRAGSVLAGLCPFHNEKSASFTVTPSRNTYHCFGCGAHGGAISFLMEYEGLPFRDAAVQLARDLGLALPEDAGGFGAAGGEVVIDSVPIYKAMERAQAHFRSCLDKSDEAKAYLEARGFDKAMLDRYCIGYAPDEWQGLKRVFGDYETNPSLLSAGLVREKASADADAETAPRRYDAFRGRITFGVRDMRSRIVAFGARALGAEMPKYINTAQTQIFDKSSALFGLQEARESVRKAKEVLVVEGYMDVVMLSQHGVGQAMAAMGTAFTRGHLERLLTQSPRIVFCFDGDAAGQDAAWKALNTCAGVIGDEHDFRFLILPDGMDPDEYVRKNGKTEFEGLVRKAPGFTEFMIARLNAVHGLGAQGANANNAEARARFASEASAIASRIGYGSRLRRIVLDQIAHESRAPGSALRSMRALSSGGPQAQAPRSIWGVIAASALKAPGTAVAWRDEIAGLLDENSEEEALLLRTLMAIDAHAVDDPGVEGFLLACDSIKGAINTIAACRESELKEELSRQLNRGELSAAEYFRLRQELGSASG